MIRNKSNLHTLSKVLATCSGCMAIAFGLTLPAYGAHQQAGAPQEDRDCVGSQVQFGCVLTYNIDAKAEVPGVYNVEIDGVTYEGVTGEITLGGSNELTLAKPDPTDADGNGNTATVTFDSSKAGAVVAIEVIKERVPAIDAMVKGDHSIAAGIGAITKGANSVAIGEGATVGLYKPGVDAKAEVPGVYNVEIGGVTYEGVTGEITLGRSSELTLAKADPTDADGNGNPATVTFDSSKAGSLATIEVVKASVPATAAVPATRMKADKAVALGAGAKVTGDNGIAIGAGVTAGKNQIRIGKAGQSAVIGGVDLAGIATNTTGIATNRSDININRSDININRSDINTNRSDINTNRSGIAMAIALGRLPSSLSAGSRGSWGIGGGTFDGKSALAGGFSFRIQEKGLVNVGISKSGGETGAGVGFSMEF